MKKQPDKIDDKKKLAEKAIQRWENEGGEVPEIASLNNTIVIEERQKAENETQHTAEVSSSSFAQKDSAKSVTA